MYILKCAFQSLTSTPYLVKSNNGWITWGNIKEAKFFTSPKELIDYLVKECDQRLYSFKESDAMVWINDVGYITFFHPKNVPE